MMLRRAFHSWLLMLCISLLIALGIIQVVEPKAGSLLGLALVLYTFVVYPTIIRLWPSRRHRLPGYHYQPSIAMIIPAHNEAHCIEEKIRNSLGLESSGEISIFVVDDASDDGTNEILKKWSRRVEVVTLPTRMGKAGAILTAASQIKSDILVLTDANVQIEKNALASMLPLLSEGDCGAVIGNTRLIQTSRSMQTEAIYQRFELGLQAQEARTGSAISLDGAFYAVKSSVFSLPNENVILDDLAIASGIVESGYRINVCEEARAQEFSAPSLRDEFRRRFRLGEGAFQCLACGFFTSPRRPIRFFQFVSHKLLRWLTPFVVLIVAPAWSSSLFETARGLHPAILGLLITSILTVLLFTARVMAYAIVCLAGLFAGISIGLFRVPRPSWDHSARGVPTQ